MIANHHELVQSLQTNNSDKRSIRSQALNEAKLKERR